MHRVVLILYINLHVLLSVAVGAVSLALPWFPRTKKDLDTFTLEGGEMLPLDHPVSWL